MLTKTVGALLAAAALAAPAVAQADSSYWAAPAQAPASFAPADRMLREAVAIGAAFWRARGFTPCSATILLDTEAIDPATGNRDADARGTEHGCMIWFDRRYRDENWEIANDRGFPLSSRRVTLEDVCQVGVHEVGHTLGGALERLWPLQTDGHTAYGIMSAEGGHTARLRECARWARMKLPRRPHR